MADFEELYREVGDKIRQTRKGRGQRLTQSALARHLGISRASVVNIECGRQRAPLHLLWQIAEILGTELTSLIPSRKELMAPAEDIQLDKEMMKQISAAARGNPETIRILKGFAGKLQATIEGPRSDGKQNEPRKSRNKS